MKGTYKLNMAEVISGQHIERMQAARALTSWIEQKLKLVRTGKESKVARGTHLLARVEPQRSGLLGHKKNTRQQGSLTTWRGKSFGTCLDTRRRQGHSQPGECRIQSQNAGHKKQAQTHKILYVNIFSARHNYLNSITTYPYPWKCCQTLFYYYFCTVQSVSKSSSCPVFRVYPVILAL